MLPLHALVRSLREFAHRRPGYMLWLGAGASASSGVPTATAIVSDLLRRLYVDQTGVSSEEAHQKEEADIREWARTNLPGFGIDDAHKSEYAQIIEHYFPVPGPREQYLKELVRKAQLSDGYRYLGLLLREGIFDTVITTNFDYLVRQGADARLLQPLVEINALEQYPRLQPFPQEPRLIRLHGDFWHGNVLNTEGELDRTPSVRHEAIRRLLQSYGLIIIGYGGWDVSIMRGIFDLIKDDPNLSQNGIFWCYPKGSTPSPFVSSFLHYAPPGRAYGVEIENFDQVMQRFAFASGLPLLTRDTIEARFKLGLEGLTLLLSLVEKHLASETSIQPLELYLQRLVEWLGVPQGALLVYNPLSGQWRIAAKIGITLTSDEIEFTQEELARFTQEDRDYTKLTVDEGMAGHALYQTLTQRYYEHFPVWQEEHLLGFIIFASNKPFTEEPQPLADALRLVKATVKLLVHIAANQMNLNRITPLPHNLVEKNQVDVDSTPALAVTHPRTLTTLIFASNPAEMPILALDEEVHAITEKIRAAEHRDVLKLLPNLATRPDDLLQALNQHRPQIVHFSGHGSAAGELILMNNQRQPQLVSAKALQALFTTLKDNIRLVVLNACYSYEQAQAIRQIIDCVIGMKSTLSDDAAITFAASFYRAIGFGRSIQAAFDQGKTALLFMRVAEADIPELLVRPGIDPDEIVLISS
ncbi:MAG: CHAT domain-containing protein [Caldilineaceae bacterium]